MFGKQKSFQIDVAHRNAFELDGFGVWPKRFSGLAIGIEQENVHDKGIGNSNIFSLFEPSRFDFLGRLIRQNQQSLFDSLSRHGRSRDHNINIGRCPLIAMRRQPIAA